MVFFGFLSAGQIFAAPLADTCVGPEVIENSWAVTINHKNQSSKEGIINAFRAIATEGFTPYMLSLPGNPDIMASLAFNPEVYNNEEAAQQAKETVISKLKQIKGVLVNCNIQYEPFPRIGVTN